MTDRHTTNTTPALTPEREAEIRAARYTDRSPAAADIDIDDLLAELDRVRAERDQFDAQLLTARGDIAAEALRADLARTAALNEAADEVVSACPDHGPHEKTWMDCHCDVADELRRMAATPAKSANAAEGVTR